MLPRVAGPARRRATTLLVVAAVVIGAAGCGSSTATPSTSAAAPSIPSPSASRSTPSPPPTPSASAQSSAGQAGVYEAINGQVEAIRGLTEKTPVEPTLVSRAEMSDVLRKEVDEQSPPALLAAYDGFYKAIGLLEPTASLRDLLFDLFDSQVAGLYVPESKRLYVVSTTGEVGPTERFFYSHEYDHALQDQHFDLEAFTKGLEDQTDRQLARQALVEGDAYVTMTYWMQQNLGPAEVLQVLAAASDPKAMQALERIPRIVQAQVLFAATQGTQWVLQLQMTGGWPAVDEVWARPPDSTEQILHPTKFAPRDPPMRIDLPKDLASAMGSGWTTRLADTLGEYQLGIWLEDGGGLAETTATDAAAGWGGDRVAYLEGPQGSWAVAVHTAWDSASDATQFEDAAGTLVGRLRADGKSADVLPGEGGTHRWVVIASDARVLGRLANALGLAG